MKWAKLNQKSYNMVTLFHNDTINVALYSGNWTEMINEHEVLEIIIAYDAN